MNRSPVHEPLPDPVVEVLIRAGLTRSTALAMEEWKAREVLDLLGEPYRVERGVRPATPTRGSI
jgi:hypothetical protein